MDNEAKMTAAAAILANTEADRRGGEIAHRAGYVRSRTPALVREHRATWLPVLEADPNTTPDQLAHPPPTSPLDGMQAAARQREQINAERDAEGPDRDDATNRAGLAAARLARQHDHGETA